MSYIPPTPITDREKYWQFSTIEPPVPDENLVQIKAFSAEGSLVLWSKAISAQNPHFMLLKDEEPFSPLSPECSLRYSEQWDEDLFDETREFLQSHLSWSPKTVVYTFSGNTYALETTWDIFLKWWQCWVFDDEGLIVLSEASSEVALFVVGRCFIETRSTPLLFIPKEEP